MTKIETIKNLTTELLQYCHEYYDLDHPTISDADYDKKFDELKALEDETNFWLANSPTRKVQGQVLDCFTKVKHSKPMLSAAKTKDINEIKKFIGNHNFYCSYKLDGLTLVVRYENGNFVQAVTRGNGEIGEDVTAQAKKIAQFTHFVSRKAMNIDGLSEKTLELLISHGFLHNFRDIYHLSEHTDKLYSLDGLGKKSVQNLLQSIENSRNVKLENFIAALGIPLIGNAASKTISKFFGGSYGKFIDAWEHGFDFTVLDDFGKTMADAMDDAWLNPNPLWNGIDNEFNFIVEEGTTTNGINLDSKSFCITGSLVHYANRDALVKAIEDNGGKYVSSVSKKTDYLINNDTTSTSGKNKKAIELNIPIISEQDFINIIS